MQRGLSVELVQPLLGAVVIFVVAIGIGTNDSSNSFGTAVASKCLSFCEVVFNSRSEILRLPRYNGTEEFEVIMYSETSALVAAGIWLILASALKLPVSTTVSIIGASLGTSLATKADRFQMELLDMTWLLVSPLLAAFVSVLFYISVYFIWKDRPNGHKASRIVALFFFTISTSLFLFVLLTRLPESFLYWLLLPGLVDYRPLPWYWQLLISLLFTTGITSLVGGFYYYRCTPKISKDEMRSVELISVQPLSTETPITWDRTRRATSIAVHRPSRAVNRQLFSVLQIVTASCEALLHGAFSYSNIVIPLAAVAHSHSIDPFAFAFFWLATTSLVSAGLVAGAFSMSYRIFDIFSEKLSTSTPNRSLPIELANLLILVVSFKMGVPISTTICKLASIAAVGCLVPSSLDFVPLKKILIAWAATIPTTGLLSAILIRSLLLLQKIR